MKINLFAQHCMLSCDMKSMTYTSLVAIITQQQQITSKKSQGNQIINNIGMNNDSEIADGHTKIDTTQSRLTTNNEGEKKRPQRDKRETLRERIVVAIDVTFFFHILGEMSGQAHVASQGSSILGYQATGKKTIYFKTLLMPHDSAVCVSNIWFYYNFLKT